MTEPAGKMLTGAIQVTDRQTGQSWTSTYRYYSDGKNYCSWCNREIITPSPYFPDVHDGECAVCELRDTIKSWGFSDTLTDELEAIGFDTSGDSMERAKRAIERPDVMSILMRHFYTPVTP